MKTFFQKYGALTAWMISVIAIGGSLFFSLVMQLPPCDMCWYQRIAMYPLALIIGIGIAKKIDFLSYALPLAIIGWLLSVYHNLLYYGIIPEAMAPCKNGVSCTTRLVEYFGFVTIPMMSFAAFTIIIASLFLYKKYK
jgi:disulfide bond formation protein DsbB